MHKLKLQPPPPIKPLIQLAVKTEKSLKSSGLELSEDEVVEVRSFIFLIFSAELTILSQRITNKILQRSAMLEDYFSMKINEHGELESLPLLQRDYRPDLNKLPLFLMRLGPQVSYSSHVANINQLMLS